MQTFEEHTKERNCDLQIATESWLEVRIQRSQLASLKVLVFTQGSFNQISKRHPLLTFSSLNRQENEVKDPAIYASTVSVTETPRLRLAPDIIKSFVFKDSAHGAAIFNMTAEAFCYSRIANPTTSVFEARMAALEGGEAALATATGSAALFTAVVTLAQRGSNIVVASSISESSTHTFKCRFPALGITCRNSETEQIVQEIDNKTAFVFVESLPSDKLLISDIESIAAAAHSKGVPLVVDNTAGAGGCLIRPIDHGADIVIQDAAPWLSISGSNSVGIIVDSGKFDWSQCTERYPQFFEPSPGFHGLKIWDKFGKLSFVSYAKAAVMRDSGPCLNPFEAFQLISGLETLSVRLERISSNALALVEWIKERTCEKQFVEVSYPGKLKLEIFNCERELSSFQAFH